MEYFVLHLEAIGSDKRVIGNLKTLRSVFLEPIEHLEYALNNAPCGTWSQYSDEAIDLRVPQGAFKFVSCSTPVRASMEFGTGYLPIVGSRFIKAYFMMKLDDGQTFFS